MLDVVASTDPAPGGGSSAALAAALGAALLEMAAGLEVNARDGGPAPSDLPERARELRAQALALADRELSSYAPVLEALRLPAGHPERAARLAAALTEASQAPWRLPRPPRRRPSSGRGSRRARPAVRGDALAGVLIAEAAATAAAALVEINLAGRDDPDLARARDARRRAQRRARVEVA